MEVSDSVYCKNVGIYAGQLTKRKSYKIIEINPQNIRIQNDENKLKWYAKWYFDLNNEPEIVSIHIDDEITDEESDLIEVSIGFANGARYWVVFTTPKYLDQMLNDENHFSVYHCIIIKNLNEKSIQSVIYQLDEQNELLENCKKY